MSSEDEKRGEAGVSIVANLEAGLVDYHFVGEDGEEMIFGAPPDLARQISFLSTVASIDVEEHQLS